VSYCQCLNMLQIGERSRSLDKLHQDDIRSVTCTIVRRSEQMKSIYQLDDKKMSIGIEDHERRRFAYFSSLSVPITQLARVSDSRWCDSFCATEEAVSNIQHLRKSKTTVDRAEPVPDVRFSTRRAKHMGPERRKVFRCDG